MRPQVNYGVNFLEFFAEEAKRVYGDVIPPTLDDRRLLVLKQATDFPPSLDNLSASLFLFFVIDSAISVEISSSCLYC